MYLGILLQFIFCVHIILIFVHGSQDCPSLYDETLFKSGTFNADAACFLDCTRSEELDVACEDVRFLSFIDVLKRVPQLNKPINVFIWSSPDIIELESGIFSPVKDHIKSLNLLGVPELINFPMLRELENIETVKIENAIRLSQFSPELLPGGIRKLVIVYTGINHLSADLQEVTPLEKMDLFVFMKHKVNSIGDKFFDIFPNITRATFSHNSFSLSRLPVDLFFTQQGLKKFILTNNNFSTSSAFIKKNLMMTIIENLNTANASAVDLSNNGLPITRDAAAALPSINNTEELSLAGNLFGQFFDSAGLFTGFDFLKRLDLSNTNLPKQRGLLRDLGSLTYLNLAGNYFRDLSRIDIFEGCKAKLEHLDLSNNFLMALPTAMSFRRLTGSISELILSGNQFHSKLLNASVDLPSPISGPFDFSNITVLDLSKTQLRTFKGIWISGLKKIKRLDLSCNSIKEITREFFIGIPSSLQILDMSFCANTKSKSPKIDLNAFSALGSSDQRTANEFNGLKTLILSSGYFKSWIFKRLLEMPSATRKNLETLDLSKNQIRYLSNSDLTGYEDLKTLNLGENYLQIIGNGTFSGMTNLISLNLSSNRIINVQNGELDDLLHLQLLDLSNNGLVFISHGAFDSLTDLTYLYLGRNFLSGYIGMFVTGGQNLLHLGLNRIPSITLREYPGGCIDRRDLEPLINLRYFYIDSSSAVFIEHGKTDTSIEARLQRYEIMPNDPYSLLCEYGAPVRDSSRANVEYAVRQELEPGGVTPWTDDFLRVMVSDPNDLSPRTFLGIIPKCYSNTFKYVANVTTNFICPNKDGKTYDPNTAKPPVT